MFSYISGRVAETGTNYAVLDVNGVGFRIFTSLHSLQDETIFVGAKAVFHTYLYVKEGIMDLYGFSTKEELAMFELLISVSGVGAKGALAILSVAAPSKLALSIVTSDTATIKKASGVGAKIAQRVVLELKDKIQNESLVSQESGAFDDFAIPAEGGARAEAVSALVVLGYTAPEAQKAVSMVEESIVDVEDIIKQALKKLL